MAYNKLYINLVIRIGLILLTCFAIAWSFFAVSYYLLIADLLVVLAIQVWLLIRYLNSINRELDVFFTSLENNDTSISSFSSKKGKSYDTLVNRMNTIKQKMNNLRMENARQYQYLKAVVDNVGIGLVVCDNMGKIELMNEAAKKLLAVNRPENIKELDKYFENFSKNLLELPSGQQIMLRLNLAQDTFPISFKVNDYRFFENSIKLISFHNIRNELDKQELESWQKLIRVLTHEIMNSTGPITSSIDSIKDFLVDEATQEIKKIDIGTLQDVVRGIEIIKERSIGLSDFVKNFKSLTVKPLIKPEKFEVLELFNRVQFLLDNEICNSGVKITAVCFPSNIGLLADKNLLEQVLINLLKNAIDATTDNKEKNIQLKAFYDPNNKLVIQIIDNGRGIPEDLMDKIFIPFFTTREKGSGIGLSISRQIMQMHQGNISVRSIPGKETAFELRFDAL
jgi:two-component system, NtrC family, nitrogen regulation sensor histidine kinase NtrY